MFMHFPCIHTLFSIYFDIFELLENFLIVSFSLSFSVYISLCIWHRNVNMLHSGTLSVLGHRLHLILLPLLFGSLIRMPERTFRRIFLDEVFIQNAESFWRTSLTLTYPMPFIVGVRSYYVTSWSHVLSC